jgi:hypothetical protein
MVKPSVFFSLFFWNLTHFGIKHRILVLCFPYFANIFISSRILHFNIISHNPNMSYLIMYEVHDLFTILLFDTIKCVLLVHLWKITHLESSNVSSCPFNQSINHPYIMHKQCSSSYMPQIHFINQLFITSCDTCGSHKCHNWSQDFLITKFLFLKGMGRKNQGLFHLNILDV